MGRHVLSYNLLVSRSRLVYICLAIGVMLVSVTACDFYIHLIRGGPSPYSGKTGEVVSEIRAQGFIAGLCAGAVVYGLIRLVALAVRRTPYPRGSQ